MKSLGIALIGYGGIARAHAQAWRDLTLHYGLPAHAIRIVGVAARREASAQAGAAETGAIVATTDAAALLSRDDVDIADICVPGEAHLEIAQLAAARQKHVYLEKPMATTLAAARALAGTIRAAGIRCQLNFNYRWFPAVQRMKSLIDEGFVGPVTSVSGRYCRASHADPGRPLSWRHVFAQSGGGAFADLGSHVLDLIVWLAGPVAEVLADARTVIARRPMAAGASETGAVDTDDETRALLRLACGARGTLEASRIAAGAANDLRLEVRGLRGALAFSLEDPNWLWAYDLTAPDARRGWTRMETVQRYAGARHPDWASALGVARGHAEGVYQFARAIWDNRPAEPGIASGLAVQAVIEAAYASSRRRAWTAVEEA